MTREPRPWTVGRVVAVVVVLAALAFILAVTYLADPGSAMCPPFCN